MERITKKREDGFYELAPDNEIYGEENGIRLVQIVGRLEDIEKECNLNIDFIKSIELCKKVNEQKFVYIKENWGIDKLKLHDDLDVELFHHRLYSNSRGVYIDLDINKYGQDWALTKEELEKW